MKNFVRGALASALVLGAFSALHAVGIDKSSVAVTFKGYKTPSKVEVDGTYKDVKATFKKESGSVPDILNGASGVVNLDSIDTKLPVRNNNIKNLFFSHLKSKSVTATFKNVKGDDKSGKGTLSIEFNGVKKDIPVTYKNADGSIVAQGEINLNDFAKEAFTSFSTNSMIQGLHGKKTWENVEVIFSAKTK